MVEQSDDLGTAIAAALALADAQGNHVVAALLAEALDTLRVAHDDD